MNAPKANYDFVSNVRFWSMMSIIAIHSIYQQHPGAESSSIQAVQLALTQILKFGTISFFVMSGFLLGENLDCRRPWSYLERRLRKVGGPWIFWAGLSALGLFSCDILSHRLPNTSLSSILFERVNQMFFCSIYWFVPNMLFALTIILCFRRYLDRLWFAFLLVLLSAFYGVNAYVSWIPSDHKIALFGFVFYLWLGNWASRHYARVKQVLDRVSTWHLLGLNIILCLASYGEARYLLLHTLGDAENTLRLSNQLFSVSVILTLMKMHPWWFSFVNVRANTFGMYLIHPVLLKGSQAMLALLGSTISRWLYGSPHPIWESNWSAPAVWCLTFVICYGGSLLICKSILRVPALRTLVGQSSDGHGLKTREETRSADTGRLFPALAITPSSARA